MSTLVFGTQVCVAVRPGVGLDFLFCVSLWASKSNSFMEPGAPQPVAQKQLWKRERLEEHWRKYGTSQKPEPKKHRGGAARQRRKRALERYDSLPWYHDTSRDGAAADDANKTQPHGSDERPQWAHDPSFFGAAAATFTPRVFYKIFSGFHSFFRLHWMFQSSTSKVLLGKQKPKIFTKSKA